MVLELEEPLFYERQSLYMRVPEMLLWACNSGRLYMDYTYFADIWLCRQLSQNQWQQVEEIKGVAEEEKLPNCILPIFSLRSYHQWLAIIELEITFWHNLVWWTF